MSESIRRRQFIAAVAGVGVSGVAAGPLLTRADVPAWDQTVEVIVAGAGAAGACAALAAREAGASVALLEALPRAGGTSALSDGIVFAGAGSAWQRAQGIEDSVEAMYAALAAQASPGLPLQRVRAYCEGSAGHVDWLQAQGIRFADIPSAEQRGRVSRSHVVAAPAGLGGQYMMQQLLARAASSGVQLFSATSAERLIAEADGRVIGLAVAAEGGRRHLRARRGVVLSCGGFIQQREMVQQYAPRLQGCATPWGGAGDLGQGIRLGISAGAAALRMDEGYSSIDLRRLGSAPSGLLVNDAGQRFIAEDAAAAAIGYAVTYEQRGSAWLITDAGSAPPPEQEDFPRLGEAATVGQLAEELGFPRGAVQQAVAYYNRYAARGEDPQFGKSLAYLRPLQGPPYRAWAVSGPRAFFPAYTLGGLATSLDGAVLDAFGEPIAGLYAAGRTCAGLPAAPLSIEGLALADATFFGRQAGASAARLS